MTLFASPYSILSSISEKARCVILAGRKTDQQRMTPLQAMNSHQKWAYQRYYANTSQTVLDPKQDQALLEHKQKEAEDAVKLHLTEALKETMQRQQSSPIGSRTQEPLIRKTPPPLMLKSRVGIITLDM